jgi:(1->4)-alpha-D-glucan 1-alpha-D-glucosylmutase
VARIAPFGAMNSLAQVVLKCTTPGVPDVYQGCETWNFSLVDPDNRRPVDYEQRKALLASLEGATPEALLADWRSGRLKLFVTQRLLQMRREFAAVFRLGSYDPVQTSGTHAERMVAFLREHEGTQIAVVVPRLTVPLGFPPIGKVWRSTAINLPAGRWRDVFLEREIDVQDGVASARLLDRFPVACLVRL